ncbi:hypothetical protein AUJ77_02000 [Candidatus Nomurabacteria bacterium CG1_02_43_90]|uniref:HicB family protein n=1 Tax=Candidatus Nomurabacteria bacterium CG1_02_43_90 TaxID=1805281 RepID=A0A1J4V3K4_9BACT|nr:MAG: hypothetical protein AUJ77_02000 [Candidatus Nomurabacteria bacterium CG1_02_43_90]
MKQQFTAVYKKSGKCYLGWVEELSGVNTQGRTLDETRKNLEEALGLVLEVNRVISRKDAGVRALREPLSILIPA